MTKAEAVFNKYAGLGAMAAKYLSKTKNLFKTSPYAQVGSVGAAAGGLGGAIEGGTSEGGSALGGALKGTIGGAALGVGGVGAIKAYRGRAAGMKALNAGKETKMLPEIAKASPKPIITPAPSSKAQTIITPAPSSKASKVMSKNVSDAKFTEVAKTNSTASNIKDKKYLNAKEEITKHIRLAKSKAEKTIGATKFWS